MRLHERIAILVLAAGFAAGPALALSAAPCRACCCPPPPCREAPSGCKASLASADCCDQAPVLVPSVSKRTVEAPACQMAPARLAPQGDGGSARPPSRTVDLARLVSPLRLSVVLII